MFSVQAMLAKILNVGVILLTMLWIGADGYCLHKGVTYQVGPFKSADPCDLNCLCEPRGGKASCTMVRCHTGSCPEGEALLPQPGKCCSQCTPVYT